MRKSTVAKYINEFTNWVNEQPVLMGYPTSMSDRTLTWKSVTSHTDWEAFDTIYVLDDEYSTFRKALAEGKQLQFYDKWKWDTEIWDDLNYTNPSFAFSPDLQYRIKTEHQTFTVGTWVRHPDDYVFQCKDDTCPYGPDYELWEPQPGEWCWFWNTGSTTAVIGQLKSTCGQYITKGPTRWDYCQPFIGELPVHLQ